MEELYLEMIISYFGLFWYNNLTKIPLELAGTVSLLKKVYFKPLELVGLKVPYNFD